MCQVSSVMLHVSYVMCHVSCSCAPHHVSFVTYKFFVVPRIPSLCSFLVRQLTKQPCNSYDNPYKIGLKNTVIIIFGQKQGAWYNDGRSNVYDFSEFKVVSNSQLFQPLGEKLSYYNGKWFSSHHFGFKCSRKLKFWLNTDMTQYFNICGFQFHRASL